MNKQSELKELTNQTNLTGTTGPTQAKPQRKYKDTLFRMLFKEKENMLSLYNALNETTYTNVDDLEVTTLENAVYMNYKNDVSFIFDFELMIYEHQSTDNPNIPLRDLIYVTTQFKGITKNDNLYGTKLVEIPAPRFVVFYNGKDTQPERKTLRLSDAYKKQQEQPELELTVTVYNINWGHNPQLLETCQLLSEYAQFVNQVRIYAKDMIIEESVEKAIDYCIENNILRDFLQKNREEATEVCIFEYDEEKHIKSERELAYQEGIEVGREEGRNANLVKSIDSAMKNLGLDLAETCQALGTSIEEYENAKRLLARL